MTPGVDLRARVRVERGAFTLDAQVHVPAGEVLAVVGPNASGKSTLLHVLAGLLAPTVGTVRLGDRVLTRTGSTGAVAVPPERRGVGLLGQDPLLFPHLSALENVAFGPRSAGTGAARARATARDWLDRVGLAGVAHQRPSQLSGGQQQRVAIGRALAAEPAALLLDEPLSALDAEQAPQVRQLLGDQLRASGTTAVVVSHDVLDAVVLADRVAVMRDGRIVEQGPCDDVFSAPRTAFTAALVGVNLLSGRRAGDAVLTSVGPLRPAAPPEVPDGAPCVVRFRPTSAVLTPGEPDAPNSFAALVRWLEPVTGGVRVRLRGEPDVLVDLPPAEAHHDWLRPGATVWAQVDPAVVHASA